MTPPLRWPRSFQQRMAGVCLSYVEHVLFFLHADIVASDGSGAVMGRSPHPVSTAGQYGDRNRYTQTFPARDKAGARKTLHSYNPVHYGADPQMTPA